MHKITKTTWSTTYVVAFLCLNLFGLTHLDEIKWTPNAASLYAEYLRYCGMLRAYRGNYTITEANVSWGKWIKGPDDVTEIGPPINQTIIEGYELQFCTAGRSNTPSGTTGYIVVKEIHTPSPIRIYWDVPFIGSFAHNITFDSNIYYVTTYNLPGKKYHFYNHDLFKKY